MHGMERRSVLRAGALTGGAAVAGNAFIGRGARAGAPRPGCQRVPREPPADWAVVAVTWLMVGAADALRTGRVAPAAAQRLVTETVLRAELRRCVPPRRG